MLSDRRDFIRTAALAAGLPTVSGFAFGMSTSSEAVPEIETVEVDRTLDSLLSTDLHEVLEPEVPFIKWLVATDALLNILGILGMRTDFFSGVNYREAGPCKGHFESLEAGWRPHFNSFNGVQRARADRDVAYLLAANSRSAVGATQYGGSNPAVSLRDDEPGVALAANLLLGENYNLSSREVAQSLTITKKEYTTQVLDGQTIPAHRYETPSISYVHYPRYRQFQKGLIVVHNKRDRQNPRNLHGARLFV